MNKFLIIKDEYENLPFGKSELFIIKSSDISIIFRTLSKNKAIYSWL